MRSLIQPRQDRVGIGAERLARAMDRCLEARRKRLSAVAGTMNALSPLSTMSRGYAVPLDDDGQVLRRVDSFETGRRFVLRVVDGRVRCQALDTETIDQASEFNER